MIDRFFLNRSPLLFFTETHFNNLYGLRITDYGCRVTVCMLITLALAVLDSLCDSGIGLSYELKNYVVWCIFDCKTLKY